MMPALGVMVTLSSLVPRGVSCFQSCMSFKLSCLVFSFLIELISPKECSCRSTGHMALNTLSMFDLYESVRLLTQWYSWFPSLVSR
jgi:hypothetical protein